MINAEQTTIRCLNCEKDVGTVTTMPETGRPGFYQHVCVPDPIPSRCITFNTIVERKTVHTAARELSKKVKIK